MLRTDRCRPHEIFGVILGVVEGQLLPELLIPEAPSVLLPLVLQGAHLPRIFGISEDSIGVRGLADLVLRNLALTTLAGF